MAEEVCDECIQEIDHEVMSTNASVSVKEMIQMYERVAENMKNTQYIEQSVMTIHTTRTNIDSDVDDKKDIESAEPPKNKKREFPLSKFHSFNRFLPKKTFFP